VIVFSTVHVSLGPAAIKRFLAGLMHHDRVQAKVSA
jgi:hypothetical protein